MTKNIQEKLINAALSKRTFTSKTFEKLKKQYAKGTKKGCLSNIVILDRYRQLVKTGAIAENPRFFKLLQKQSMRTLSGIASITVITKPYPCPGNCLYCPTEQDMPKSYLSDEPAIMRAVLTKFDPYKQMATRIKSLHLTGHSTDKIELIVLGGTWSAYPKKYQAWFIKRCFDAANEKTSKDLTSAKKLNVYAKNRIIGLTLETRPDYITKDEIIRMRKFGATRVELGVQTTDDKVLDISRRGHKTSTTIRATKLLKDAGFKINYHLMPNLPGSTPKKDLQVFDRIFSDSDFRPDLMKLYPCVVTRDSDLEKLYKSKKYEPYSDKQLIDLICQIKSRLPRYVRIMRLGRDIPAGDIIGGNKISNIRQVVAKEMIRKKLKCQCIRCREVKDAKADRLKARLFREDYDASDGKEVFLTYESPDHTTLFALLRLRIPSYLTDQQTNKPTDQPVIPALKNSAIIREVHTYGESLPIDTKKDKVAQHFGFGKKLMKEAEGIAKNEHSLSKISVISGVGVRDYYRKLGYRLQNEYMIKVL